VGYFAHNQKELAATRKYYRIIFRKKILKTYLIYYPVFIGLDCKFSSKIKLHPVCQRNLKEEISPK